VGAAGTGAAGAAGTAAGVTTGAPTVAEVCDTFSKAAEDTGAGLVNGFIITGAAFLVTGPVANLGDTLAEGTGADLGADLDEVPSFPLLAASLSAAGTTIVLRHFAHLSSFTILSVAGLRRIFAPQLLQTRILSITSSLYSYLLHKNHLTFIKNTAIQA
jgi:hypothetical protein